MAIYYYLKKLLFTIGAAVHKAGIKIAKGCIWFFTARGCTFCEHYQQKTWPINSKVKRCMEPKEYDCKSSITRTAFERRKE